MRNLLLAFWLLVFACGYAQVPKTMDSLKVFLKSKPRDTTYVLALNEYAFLKVQEGDFDEVKKTIAQMKQISEKFNFGNGFYKVENMRGIVEYSNQEFEKAMEYFLKCEKIIKQYKLPKRIYQNWLNNVGIIYGHMGDDDNATKCAMKLMDYQEKNKLEPLKTYPYQQLGDNLKKLKKYDEALSYYNKSLEISTRYKNYLEMAVSENSIGNLYDDMQRVPDAIKHYQTGLQYAEKANYKLHQTDFLTNLGRMHRQLKQYDKAEGYLLKAEKICGELEVTEPLKTIYQGLGDVYFFKKQFQLSESYYLKSLAIAKTIENPEFMYSINEALTDLYEKTGDYKKAFAYKVQAGIYKDSTFQLETAQNNENLLRKYEAKKRSQAITTLQAQNTIKNLEIENANKQRWYFVFGIVLLGIIGGLLFYQSRNRQKTNQKLQLLNAELDQANKTKMRFFSILNHDLRSPVSNLIHFLHLQKENPELLDAESKTRLESKTITGAENLLGSMEDILLWSKGQMENFKPEFKTITIESIFEDNQKHFSSEENVALHFENPQNLELKTDENYLKTIIRNLTGNAIKALEKTPDATIIWKAWQENNVAFLSIADNGPGGTAEKFKALYDETEVVGIKSGLGLHLVRDLAKAINCSITVETKPNSGTTFILKMP